MRSFLIPAQLEFIDHRQVANDAYSFNFHPTKPLKWRAGQHGLLELRLANGKASRRMFSLSSAPSEGIITITTRCPKEHASKFKQALMHLQPGDKAWLRGPVGPMFVRQTEGRHVFIAAGIGITPVRSMLIEARLNSLNLTGELYYVHSSSEKIFGDELDQVASQLPGLKVIYTRHLNDIDTLNPATYYLSGSPSFIRHTKRLLKDRNVPSRHIKSDPFYGFS